MHCNYKQHKTKDMTLRQKIQNEIKNVNHDENQYTDNYDGFTHASYKGLIEQVIECFEEEHITNPTNNEIYEMICENID